MSPAHSHQPKNCSPENKENSPIGELDYDTKLLPEIEQLTLEGILIL